MPNALHVVLDLSFKMEDEFNNNPSRFFRFSIPPAPSDAPAPRPGPYLFHGIPNCSPPPPGHVPFQYFPGQVQVYLPLLEAVPAVQKTNSLNQDRAAVDVPTGPMLKHDFFLEYGRKSSRSVRGEIAEHGMLLQSNLTAF
ncbi:hypothetical protein OS493_037331 [Desmophyllum pertusum]|uniref:Uncharacterized protein n=1 Tax=Desmophyllum pertusum TaxID=174260 RepID=A0A9W9YUG3_9CNID|nr:hypothetical protein OS493_037331 [Desmophyllum pertusum]